MADHDGVQRADRRFFDALLTADGSALNELLDEAFLIVDVAAGGVTGRDAFVEQVTERSVRFVRIDLCDDVVVRAAGTAAVIVGRTAMEVAFPDGHQVAIASRYTHVFVVKDGSWKLFSAQGTSITE